MEIRRVRKTDEEKECDWGKPGSRNKCKKKTEKANQKLDLHTSNINFIAINI